MNDVSRTVAKGHELRRSVHVQRGFRYAAVGKAQQPKLSILFEGRLAHRFQVSVVRAQAERPAEGLAACGWQHHPTGELKRHVFELPHHKSLDVQLPASIGSTTSSPALLNLFTAVT